MVLKACSKGFEQNIIKNYKNLIRIKEIKVWTTKIGVCYLVYFKFKTRIAFFFLLFASTFTRVLEKRKKKIVLQIESDWVWKYYTKYRTNSVKPQQNRIKYVWGKFVWERRRGFTYNNGCKRTIINNNSHYIHVFFFSRNTFSEVGSMFFKNLQFEPEMFLKCFL